MATAQSIIRSLARGSLHRLFRRCGLIEWLLKWIEPSWLRLLSRPKWARQSLRSGEMPPIISGLAATICDLDRADENAGRKLSRLRSHTPERGLRSWLEAGVYVNALADARRATAILKSLRAAKDLFCVRLTDTKRSHGFYVLRRCIRKFVFKVEDFVTYHPGRLRVSSRYDERNTRSAAASPLRSRRRLNVEVMGSSNTERPAVRCIAWVRLIGPRLRLK